MGRAISGSISLPCPGFFSPFPHGTGCTIGDKPYLALPSGLGGFTRGSTCPVLLGYHLNSGRIFKYGALTLCGRTFQSCFSNSSQIFFSTKPQLQGVTLRLRFGSGGPTTLAGKPTSLGFSAFARRYLRNLFDFFSSGYLDVSVHRVAAPLAMCSPKGRQALP